MVLMQGIDEPELDLPDGPVRETKPEDVSQEGAQLVEGFEWVTMDLTDEAQVYTSRRVFNKGAKLNAEADERSL
jgi:hypothetical protein